MNAPHPASSALAAERPTLADLEARDAFAHRHIGPSADEQTAMLGTLGYTSRAALKNECAAEQQALLKSQQEEMEKDAVRREQVAVTSAVRKLVAHLTGVDPPQN